MSESNLYKRLIGSPAAPLMAVYFNLLLLFVCYFICRLEFLLVNYSYFSQSLSEGGLTRLFLGGTMFDTPAIMYTNALWILLILLPFHLKERRAYEKVCKWIFVVVNTVAIIANMVDSVYFRFSLRRSGIDVFSEFGNEDNVGKILLTETVSHWYLVLLVAVMVWGLWRLYMMPKVDVSRCGKVRYYIAMSLSLLFAALICVSGIRGGFLNHWYNYVAAVPLIWLTFEAKRKGVRLVCGVVSLILIAIAPVGGWRHRDIRPIAVSNAAKYVSRPIETALVLNTPFTMIRMAGKTKFTDPGYFSDKTLLASVYSPVHQPSGGDKRRKNVVIIIMESFGREYVGALGKEVIGQDYKGYTPFLDSLINHSLTFRHSYGNGLKSIDGIPSVLTGIPYMVEPFILTPYSLNKMDGLATLLGREGYQTAFFHGARRGSMGFDAISKAVGFKEYYGREDFNEDSRFNGDKDFDGYWAIWDEPFMQYYSAKMSDMKQPFVTALFSASSHHPFRVPEQYEGKFPEGTMPIHKCIGYSDNALREFFNRSKGEEWFDNTIFVIVNDHNNMTEYDGFKSDIGRFYDTLIFYDPSGEIGVGSSDLIAQQIDIMPTLLGYLGYDKPYVAFGKDLALTKPEDSWAVSYINGVYQLVKDKYVLQFDGSKSIGLYGIEDYGMTRRLTDHPEEEKEMEMQLKAIIQQYMDRMITDRLTDTLHP